MEHLPVPREPLNRQAETVKFVCSKSYDDGGFLEYPIREGVNHALPLDGTIPGGSPFWLHEQNHPTPNEHLEDFFQRWLFFGLIHEILGPRYPCQELVRYVDGTQILSTANLVPILDTWVADVQAGACNPAPTYEHVSKCLRLTFATLRAAGPDFDPLLKLCLASLGEVLAFATNRAFKIMNLVQDNLCPSSWTVPEIIKQEYWLQKWLDAGWCPSQVYTDTALRRTIQSLYFVSRLGQRNVFGGHQRCTKSRCDEYQVNLDNYKTQHVSADCQCHELAIDANICHEAYQTGHLPLIRIRDEQSLAELSVEVVTSNSETKYIAFSHVWADGLGNPTNNALPRCQLSLLGKFAQELDRTAYPTEIEENDHLLWIDTLCCPVEPKEAKNTALSQMKKVYETAASVLVVDASIRLLAGKESDAVENGVRIATSGWMRRLWTLQEAVLPASKQRLWFQTQDGPVNIEVINSSMIHSFTSSVGQRGLSMSALTEVAKFSAFFADPSQGLGASLDAIQAGLANRSVSVASDEPLLIANLLGLDTEKILDSPESSRMRQLWSLMPQAQSGIPRNIIFRSGPRLNDTGFRWAPATLLYRHPSDAIKHGSSRDVHQQGIPCEHGLEVHLTGYRCHMPPNASFLTPWKLVRLEERNSLWSRNDQGKWYLIIRRGSHGEDDFLPRSSSSLRTTLRDESSLFLLHEPVNLVAIEARSSNDRHSTSALLVQSLSDAEPIKYVRSMQHLTITLCPADTAILLEAAYQAAQKLTEIPLVREMTSKAKETGGTDTPEYKAKVVELRRKLDETVASTDEGVLKVAQQSNESYGPRLYLALIAGLLVGEYGRLGPRLPDDQKWCVD